MDRRAHGWLARAALAACAACSAAPPDAVAQTPSLDPPVLQLPAGTAAKHPRLPVDDGRTLLVRLRGGASHDAVARAHGGRAGSAIPGTGFRRLTVSGARLHGTLRALARDGRVADVVLNRRRSIDAVPNDPWAVKTGAQNWQQTVRLPTAWDATKGSSTLKVAVVDTGVDLDHRELAPKIVAGRDVVHADDRADDANGHGTMVAGLAAAATDNALGVAGTAWNASVVPVQVLDDDGAGYDDDIATGITWAADQGADVINLSLGGPGDSPVLRAAVEHARAQGAIVVAAAGNDGSDEPSYPAAIPGVVAVAATDWSGRFMWFSNHGDHVDLAAPGNDLVGLTVAEGPRERYERASGTSLSAPIVSGVAALVLAQHPTWTPDQVAARLRDTSRDAGPPGTDPYYGAGVLDAAAATGSAPLPASRPPAGGEASEPNDTPDRTTAVPLTANFEGRFAPEGDVDWYSVQVPTTGWLSVGANKTSAFDGERAEETDVAVELYGPNLEKLGEADGQGPAGDAEELFHNVKTPGRYYVRARNALGSQGTYTLSVTQGTTPDVSDARFTAGQWYPTGSWPSTVTTGDVTGDGRRDVLMTTTSYMGDEPDRDYKLFVYRQDADGWLDRPQILGLDGAPASIATGDMDGDGATDAVVPTGLGVEILHQRGGALGAGEFVFTGSARSADVVDLDADGDRDLVTHGLGKVQAAVQTATGWRVLPVLSASFEEVEVGDVTGDGRPDAVAIGTFGVYVLAQTSTGRWAEPVRYGGPELQCGCLDGLELAELTGDGRLDVAVTSSNGDSVLVVPQTTTGTLGTPRAPVSAGPNPEPLEAGDLDGDGRADLAVAAGGYQQLNVLRQPTAGTLAARSSYRVPYASHYESDGLAIGDVSGDGRQDVVLADYNHGLVVNRNAEGSWPAAANGVWVRNVSPADGSQGNAAGVTPIVRFGRAVDATTVTGATVRLTTAAGGAVAATVSYDAPTRVATVRPSAALATGAYALSVSGVRSTTGATMPGVHRSRFRVGAITDTAAPDTVIDAVSSRTSSLSAARVTFHATEPAATFECAIDDGAFSACESPWYEFGDTDGTHTVRVRARDAAGNLDATPATRTFVVSDTFGAPNDLLGHATVISGESGTAAGANRAASKDSFEMDHAGNPGGASVWWRWTAPRDGPVTFETTGSDFDTLLGVSIGSAEESRAEFQDVVASNDDAGAGVVTSRAAFVARAGQTYNVAVDGFDAIGYGPATGTVSLRWAMQARSSDTTAPNTTIVEAPPSPTRDFAGARFRFTSTEADGTFECRRGITGNLGTGGWRTCSPGVTYELFDGDWTFEVRAVDAAGNRDTTPATHRWVIDTLAPTVVSLSGTAGTTASTNASFTFTLGNGATRAECRLDSGAWQTCTSPRSYTGLAEGHHRFDVRAVDAAGNAGELAWSTWTIDATAPALDTRLFGGPSDPTTSRWAFFEFTSPRGGATFQCRLDSGLWEACSSPYYTGEGLADGEHTFAVRAVDGTEVDMTPATRTWTIGTPPPLAVTITDGPPSVTSSRDASFTFSANRSAATFTCSVDGGPFTACQSPKVYTGMADGPHNFMVRATDGTGATMTASRPWNVDTAAPAVAITGGPSGTVASRDASFSFTAESGATVECSLDSGAFSACSSPKAYSALADGSHTFVVRARDGAGNSASASRTWTVAMPPPAPDTAITDGPSGLRSSASATFTFSSPDAVDRFECRLDTGAWATCTSPRELTALSDGAHTFAVRAVNAGGADATPASRTWTVDTTSPDTRIDSAPPAQTTDTTPDVAFSSTEAAGTFACRIDDGPEVPCTSPHTVQPLASGPHRIAVRATDAAGNADATPATAEFTVVPPTEPPPPDDPEPTPDPPADPEPPVDPVTTSERSAAPDPGTGPELRDVIAPALNVFRVSVVPRRRTLQITLKTSEGGVMSLRFERCRVRGRRRCATRRPIGSRAREVGPGVTSVRLGSPRLAVGRYRVIATVTDAAGNVSGARVATVVVRARRR